MTDEQPTDPSALRREFAREAPQGFTDEDAARFDLIIGSIGVMTYPVSREDVLLRLRERDAPENVLVDVRSLPDGARYGSVEDLLLALGVGTAGRIDVPGAPPRDPQGGAPARADEA